MTEEVKWKVNGMVNFSKTDWVEIVTRLDSDSKSKVIELWVYQSCGRVGELVMLPKNARELGRLLISVADNLERKG